MKKVISTHEKQIAIQGLSSLGLPLAEAKTYVALLEQGASEATPLSKTANVPQPKIYSYLKSLENKGYIVKMDITGRPNLYKPLSYEIVIESLKEQMNNHIQSTENILEKLEQLQKDEPNRDYITVVQGEKSVKDGLRDLFVNNPQNLLIFDTGYYGNILEDQMEKYPLIEIIKPFKNTLENINQFPPFLQRLFSSPALDQIRKNAPLLIFENVSENFASCKSTSIIAHPVEEEEPLFIRITHSTIVDFQIKMLKVLMDLFGRMVSGDFE